MNPIRPIQMSATRAIHMYQLVSSAQRRVESPEAIRMMTPPMVGVPAFPRWL